jgi:NDP-sugar pyrophosphorylase family protein
LTPAVSNLSHALVLTAGLGTRLSPLTHVRAKPAIPVAGQPLIRRILAGLVSYGVTDVTLNLHHLPHTLTAVVGDGSDLGARVRYSWEQPRILGSAGGPRQALDIVGASTFFLINGDTISDVSLRGVADAHQASDALVTLALVPNTQYLHYGGVRLAADGAVVGFVGRGPEAAGSFHLFGVQVVSRQAFASLTLGQAVNSIGGLYDRLIAERPGSIKGWISSAQYWDIGTVADYWKTSHDFLGGREHPVGSSTRIAASAIVTRSIIWDDVEVGDRAILDECIVTDGVTVPEGAAYRRMILARGADGEISATPFIADE